MNYNSVEILLVNDNVGDAELTIRELKKHNMSNDLVHVKNSEDALDFIFATGPFAAERDVQCPPKLILLDMQMLKEKGIELFQKIKLDKRTRSTPVVILISSEENPDIQRCFDLGANSYIVKPLHFESLTKAIKNLDFYWLLLNPLPE